MKTWGIVPALLLACLQMTAQTPTATVVGTIQDPSGAAVPGAAIKVRNVDTNHIRQAATDEKGEFTVVDLAPGNYEVAVEKRGFNSLVETGLVLEVNQTARLILGLQVGSVTQTIEVKASVPLVNTENAAKGDVIVTEEIAQMPLESRNFSDLAFLVPGVSQKADSDVGSSFAVNGARSDNVGFLVGGFNVRDMRYANPQVQPNLDAMQEFKMETSGYSAEYGGTSGGVMNMVLKSGSNRPHGSVFEFLRNDALDARNFFADDKDKLRRNQFGGQLSGPVWIPKIFNGKNRTFFLFSWESYRQVSGATRLSRVPTGLERAGDFSQTTDASGKLVRIKDPQATGACSATAAAACFPGNRIPVSRFSAVSTKILPYYPLPNRPGQANNFYNSAVANTNYNSFVVKLDHRFSKDNFSFQYVPRGDHNTFPFDGSDLGTFGSASRGKRALYGLTYTRIIAPTLINEARFGLTRVTNAQNNNDAGHNFPAELGISGLPSDSYLAGFPSVQVRGLATVGDKADRPVDVATNIWQWADTVTWVKGSHQFKMGGQIIRNQNFAPYYNNARGSFTFLGNYTGQPFADFQLGLMETAARQVQAPHSYLFSNNYGLFFQDDFRLSSRLTLNLGMRHEIATPMYDKYGRFSNFVPDLGKIIVADDRTVPNLNDLAAAANLAGKIGVARDYGFPSSLMYTKYNKVAPRFGLAWRPFGGNSMVVRGGYGIYYGTEMTQPVVNNAATVFPFSVTQNANRSQADPALFTFANPFQAVRGLASVQFNGFDPRAAPPYQQSWNFTVERGLGATAALELSYAGSKGTHLSRSSDINQPYYDGSRQANGTFPRPYPSVGNTINYYTWDGNSDYNAATVTLRRRFTRGFFYRVNYTYSKSIDEGSSMSGGGQGGGQRVQDPHNRRGERGRSNWDAGHSFTMDFSYSIPTPWKGRGSGLVKGWQMAGTGRASTGRPFTPRTSTTNLNLGGAIRPDRIAKGTVSNPTPDHWFDLSAFPPVPVGKFGYGDSGRNILDGPGYAGINLSLIKNTRWREFGNLQFRWEVFNILNHANFGTPIAFVDQVTGGTITSASAPRVMQFGMRYDF